MKKILFIILSFLLAGIFVSCEEYDNGYYTYIPPVVPEPPKVNEGSDYYPYDRIINAPLDNFLEKVCIVDNERLNYRMLFPKNYVKGEKYPLIVVLHGTGERGDNNSSQLAYGGNFFVKDEIRDNYPAIVVYPQCPSDVRWDSKIDKGNIATWTWDYKSEEGTAPTELLLFLIEDMVAKEVVDSTKMYVGGISMGAMGAYEVAYRLPKFAAGFFMSGGGNPADIAEKLPNMAFRIMHGDQDGVVLPAYATDMYDVLSGAGIESKLDIYPGVSHSGWNNMFEEPDFMSWLWGNKLDQ